MLARWAICSVALVGALELGVVATTFASAQSDNSASRIPATWTTFSAKLQTAFQARLAGQDDAARQFQDFLSKRFDRPGTPPPSVVVRAWIGGDGKVARLEFEGVFD